MEWRCIKAIWSGSWGFDYPFFFPQQGFDYSIRKNRNFGPAWDWTDRTAINHHAAYPNETVQPSIIGPQGEVIVNSLHDDTEST